MRRVWAFLLTFLVPVLVFGQTYDYAVNVEHGYDYVRYYGTVDMSSDTTGSHYTQAFLLGNLNDADGAIQVSCSEAGTEDVNAFFEYSHDRKTWTAGTTDTDLDALGTTVVNDTVGVAAGTDQWLFHNLTWGRLHFDGQTGNQKTTVTWSIVLHRDPVEHFDGKIFYVGSAANKK